MFEEMRKLVDAAIEQLTPANAKRLARSLSQGEAGDQINRAAQDLLRWSKSSSDHFAKLVRTEVKRQLASAGVATKEDVASLRARLREVEKATGVSTAAKRSPAKRSSGTRPKPPAKKSSAKRPAAKRAGANRAGGSKGSSR